MKTVQRGNGVKTKKESNLETNPVGGGRPERKKPTKTVIRLGEVIGNPDMYGAQSLDGAWKRRSYWQRSAEVLGVIKIS